MLDPVRKTKLRAQPRIEFHLNRPFAQNSLKQ